MSRSPHPTKTPAFAEVCRGCLRWGVLLVGVLVLVNAVVLEPFHIPTGSMAPALRGQHRVCACPRCGQEVVVGRAAADANGSGEARYYQKVFCQNCGHYPVPLAGTIESPGDKVLVNKCAYVMRAPARWEVIVFRLFGGYYIKRLLGLPGESITIHDGDLYVNGKLCRKTLDEARSMRILLFDQSCRPAAGQRWDFAPLPQPDGESLHIDGRLTPQTAAYRPILDGALKCEPIQDEYAYNGGVHDDVEAVHDFLIETEVEVTAGPGTLALRLCDGHDCVEVLLPVGDAHSAEVFSWPADRPEKIRKLAEIERLAPLQPGRRHQIEMALIDRRVSLVVDGLALVQLDLPEAKERGGVAHPFQAQADGVRATLHRFHLYRDVHYGQQGKNAVQGKSVRLGVDQYFLLGDNSPNSSDSRFWPDEGRVPGHALVGSVLLLHRAHAEGTTLRWLP
jgi:signal peptidase I